MYLNYIYFLIEIVCFTHDQSGCGGMDFNWNETFPESIHKGR